MKTIYDITGLIPEEKGVEIYNLSHLSYKVNFDSSDNITKTIGTIEDHIKTINKIKCGYIPRNVLAYSGIAFINLNELIIEAINKSFKVLP